MNQEVAAVNGPADSQLLSAKAGNLNVSESSGTTDSTSSITLNQQDGQLGSPALSIDSPIDHGEPPKTPKTYSAVLTPPPSSLDGGSRSAHHADQPPHLPLSPDRMAEISDSLRTRLSYAVLKIKKGWTDYSLGQLESLQAKREAHQIINGLAANREAVYSSAAFMTTSKSKSDSASRMALAPPLTFKSEDFSSSQLGKPSSAPNNLRINTGSNQLHTPTTPKFSKQGTPKSTKHKRTSSDGALVRPIGFAGVRKGSTSPGSAPRILETRLSGKRRRVSFGTSSELQSAVGKHALPATRNEEDAAESLVFLSSPCSSSSRAHF